MRSFWAGRALVTVPAAWARRAGRTPSASGDVVVSRARSAARAAATGLADRGEPFAAAARRRAGSSAEAGRVGLSPARASGGCCSRTPTAPFAVHADGASFIESASPLRREGASAGAAGRGSRRAADACAYRTLDRWCARHPPRPRRAMSAPVAIPALFVLLRDPVAGRSPATLGIVLGAGAIGGVLGSLATGRIVDRRCSGAAVRARAAPAARAAAADPLVFGPAPSRLGVVCVAAFGAGLARCSPTSRAGGSSSPGNRRRCAARMFGAYQPVSYGVRPTGPGGRPLGAAIGLSPTPWIAGTGPSERPWCFLVRARALAPRSRRRAAPPADCPARRRTAPTR